MATCNHILACTGIDPATPWRGSYDDEAGARAIYEAHGGVLGLFRHGMAMAGFVATDRARGRPVVCSLAGREIAGLDMGRFVIFMAEGRGMIEIPANVIEAWEI